MKANNSGYDPKVTVSKKVIKFPLVDLTNFITVADKGNGIPQYIITKIYHSFLTTRTMGQATVSVLPLVYHILTNVQHGIESKADSNVEHDSTFIMEIPSTRKQ